MKKKKTIETKLRFNQKCPLKKGLYCLHHSLNNQKLINLHYFYQEKGIQFQ